MSSQTNKYCIRAEYDQKTITVFQAFSNSIAKPALEKQKLVPPFSYDRMTWIKPSFLWLMYRSDWARAAGMEKILGIRISRTAWDEALREAILTTPSKRVYPDAKAWRKKLNKSRIRVQWDPERDLLGNRTEIRSIQVGVSPALSREYATKWIVSIEDWTEKSHKIHRLRMERQLEKAAKLLPKEQEYPVDAAIEKALGM